jgi:hypothetical protein
MAANLSGMFAQLNNAIQGSPMGNASGGAQRMLDMGSQGLGNMAGGMTDRIDPYAMMTPAAQQTQGKQDLAGLDLSTQQGMADAAGIYGKMGETTNQLAMAQAAEKKRLDAEALQRQQSSRESLAKRATDVGLGPMGENILLGEVDMKEAAKVIRDEELTRLASKRTGPLRKGLAKQLGISAEEYEESDLAQATGEEFKDYVNAREADVKPFLNADGVIVSVPVSKGGTVRDPKDGQWKYPSEAGFTTAPNVSKVIDASSRFAGKMAEAGVANFVDMHEKANNAQLQLDNIARSLEYLEDMPTGIGAPIEAFVGKVASYMGMPTPEITNYETFIAEAGKRVAEQIKAFGSGTGLSDADREYAKLIAAADPTLKAASLKRLLEIQRTTSQETVSMFTNTKSQIRNEMGGEGYMVDSFTLRSPGMQSTGGGQPNYIFNPATGKLEQQ